MGAGGAASESILFVGAVIVATALFGALFSVSNSLSSDLRERGEQVSRTLRSDIVVINDPLKMTTSPLKLYAKNVGRAHLNMNLVSVLVDGQVSASLTLDVLQSTNDPVWKSGEVLQITVNDLTVGAGDHRVRVVAETGREAVLEFTV